MAALTACGVKGLPLTPADTYIVPWSEDFTQEPPLISEKQKFERIQIQAKKTKSALVSTSERIDKIRLSLESEQDEENPSREANKRREMVELCREGQDLRKAQMSSHLSLVKSYHAFVKTLEREKSQGGHLHLTGKSYVPSWPKPKDIWNFVYDQQYVKAINRLAVCETLGQPPAKGQL